MTVMCHLLPQSHLNFVIAVTIMIITQANVILVVIRVIVATMEIELLLHLIMLTVEMTTTTTTHLVEEGIAANIAVKVEETLVALRGIKGQLEILLSRTGDLNTVSNLFFF